MGLVLLESGAALLLESGTAIILDSVTVPAAENFSGTSASSTAMTFMSTGSSRDMEVSFASRPAHATVFLRYDSVNDKALYCTITGATSLVIGLASGISGQSWSTPSTTIAKMCIRTGPGTGALVVGVAGFDIYVKVGGVEQFRFKDSHTLRGSWTSGKAAVKVASGDAYNCTVTFLTPTSLHSVPANNWFDIRDFGCKPKKTTGSIASGSSTLNVVDPSFFAVGDYVVVAVGGESGAGARGTVGVGGNWPALSYADATARTADAGQASNTWAWQQDTGAVYRWNGSSWDAQSSYYFAQSIPKALFAQITAISGNNLMLSVAATTAATNATVYFDNATKITQLMTSQYYVNGANGNSLLTAFEPDQITAYIPAGEFAFAGLVRAYHGSYQVRGAGDTSIWRYPAGSPGGLYLGTLSTGTVAKDFKQIGNLGDNGFALAWTINSRFDGYNDSGPVYVSNEDMMSTATSSIAYPRGVWVDIATDAKVYNITSVNMFYQAVGFTSCTNPAMHNCAASLSAGVIFRTYIQWLHQIADSTGNNVDTCGIFDCSGVADKYTAGVELFRCTGDISIQRYTGTNCSASNNSSGTAGSSATSGILYKDNTITMQANAQDSGKVFATGNPVFNINANIGGGYVGLGMAMVNNTVTVQGVMNSTFDISRAITVAGTMSNTLISGGTLTLPDYVDDASVTLTDTGHIISDAAATVCSNISLVGASRHAIKGTGNKQMTHRNNSTIANGSSVTNCGSDYTLS